MEKHEIEARIQEIETAMNAVDFWNDKVRAQEVIQEFNDLKGELLGVDKYDKSNAIMTLFAGAGGQDSENFTEMLLSMYEKYAQSKGWMVVRLHRHMTDHGGYRNVTIEIVGKNAYGILKNESGVHRLVRLSPFNASNKRHTSFAMVEVVPVLEGIKDVDIDETDLQVEFSKSSGPGGQNVNKRETAVRIVHKPTGLSAHSDGERLQERNRAKALEILLGKLYHKREEDKKKEAKGLAISATVDNEWGNQIRSYVLHPYKMVKDHRTNTEIRDTEKVFNGGIDEFIEAEKSL